MIVPRIKTADTVPNALPGARVSTQTPQGAFQPAAQGDYSPILEQGVRIRNDWRDKADQIAILDADNKLAQMETDLLYNPQTGLLNKRGRDSFNAPEEFNAAWMKGVGSIEAGLKTDRQKQAFKKAHMERQAAADRTVQRHVAEQIRAYDDDVFKSFLTNEANGAVANYNDDERIDLSVARQQLAIEEYAKRNGLDPEVSKQMKAEATSRTRTAVVNRMLANEEDQAAKTFYERYKDDFSGTDRAAVEKSIEEASTRGESQRKTDEIVKTAKNRAEALEEARKIKDPQVRDATENRVNQYYSEQRAIKKEAEEDLYLRATNIVDANPGVPPRNVIPASMWATMDLEHRRALENRAASKADGSDLVNNNREWLRFLDMTPQALGSMTQAEFETKYWSKFDKEHRERAATQWAAARDAVRNGKQFTADPKYASTITFKDRTQNTLRTAGIIKSKTPGQYSDSEADTYARFETEAAKRVQEFEVTQLKGERPASGSEIQGIIDKMVVEKVFIDKTWARDVEKPALAVKEDEQGRAYVPVDQIPPSIKNEMYHLSLNSGIKYTNERGQRAYAAMLMGNKQLVLDILTKE